MDSPDNSPHFCIDHDTAMGMVIRPSALAAFPSVTAAYGNEGYLVDVPYDYKLRRLRKLMGPDRYQEVQNIQAERDRKMAAGRFNEAPSENTLYKLLRTTDEAHCFYSIQVESSQAANASAYDAVVRSLPPGSVVADLGCYTGTFARFIATTHPSFTVYGFDHLPSLVDLASDANTHANAHFELWDYLSSDGVPSVQAHALTSSLGIPFGDLITPDDALRTSAGPREAPVYEKALAVVHTAAGKWALIAAPNAWLCITARAGTVPLILAITDGCRAAGWQLKKPLMRILQTSTESLPFFVFQRVERLDPSSILTAEEATAFWFAGLLR